MDGDFTLVLSMATERSETEERRPKDSVTIPGSDLVQIFALDVLMLSDPGPAAAVFSSDGND